MLCCIKLFQKYFQKLQECRNWYADARFEDEHGGITMNLYVHVTENEKVKEVESIEKMLNVM